MRRLALELFAASAVLLTSSCAGDDSSETDSFSATEQPVPPQLQHSDADSPVPTWEQLTRDGDPTRTAHVVRIVALHVGIAGDGSIEVHMELYDPIYTNGAPLADLYWAPASAGSTGG